jgi:hypothetical protein
MDDTPQYIRQKQHALRSWCSLYLRPAPALASAPVVAVERAAAGAAAVCDEIMWWCPIEGWFIRRLASEGRRPRYELIDVEAGGDAGLGRSSDGEITFNLGPVGLDAATC